MNSPSPIIFETERLYAREFVKEDADSVYAYAGNAENTQYMDWGPESYEDVVKFIESRLAMQLKSPRTEYDLALCLKETDELIGAMGIYYDPDGLQAMLGYTLNMTHWHRGYATEAAKGFLMFGFLGLDLKRIWAKCDTENTASAHVLERIGMRREAHFIKNSHVRVRQKLQWRSEYYYAILQKEYLNSLPDGEYSPSGSLSV